MRIKYFLIIILLFGIYTLSAVFHEAVHMYQLGFADSEACFSIKDWTALFYTRPLTNLVTWDDRSDLSIELPAYVVSTVVILACVLYIYKRVDLF